MGDPGPDYDQRAQRRSLVRFMMHLGQRDGCAGRMRRWRDQEVLVFHPNEEEEMEVGMKMVGGEGDGVKGSEEKKELVEKDDVKVEVKGSWGMDEEVMCWECTTVKDGKEKKDSKTAVVASSFGHDALWTINRVTLS